MKMETQAQMPQTGDDKPQPPDLSAGTEPSLRRIEGGIVVPVPAGEPMRSVQRSGVLTGEGELVAESLTWRGTSLVSQPPSPPDPAGIVDLPGRHMFAGILFGHFGHFLVESTARLWAWDMLRGQIDGIVFVPKVQRNVPHVLKTQAPFLRMLGIDCALHAAETPLRVETLHVPQMGFGLFQMIEGLPEYRSLMRSHFARDIAPEGGENLYISRTRLPPERGGLFGEEKIEGWLEAEGYEIYHPQQHSLAAQVARYKAARRVISPDGSPLHLLALTARPDLRLAIIPRRPDGTAEMLARQLRAFAMIEPDILAAPDRNWIPVRDSRPSRTSFGVIDIADLGQRLARARFIANPAAWVNHSAAESEAFLEALRLRQKTDFKLFEDQPKTAA